MRVFLFELARGDVERALCLREREAGPEACDAFLHSGLGAAGGHAEGKPHFDLGVGKLEFGGHYADDGVGLIGDGKGAADSRGVGMEAAAPEAVAEEGFMIAVAEGAAEFRGDAEDGEEAGGGAARDDLVGLSGAVNGHVVAQVPAGFFEKVAAVAPGQVVVGGDAILGAFGAGFFDAYEARGGFIERGAEKDGIDDAEDGGVGADSEGEDGDDGDGERGIVAQPAERP